MIRGKIAALLLAALTAGMAGMAGLATAAAPALAAPRQGQGTEWAQAAAGFYNTCGVRTDGTLWCWGNNFYGQLGVGNDNNLSSPQQVTTPAATGWASVTVGEYYTCATRTNRTLWCWGLNAIGELGIHSHIYQEYLPQQVTTRASAGGWTSVSATGSHTCATRIGGSLWCWGDNAGGDLGIGNNYGQDVPRQVTSPAVNGWTSVTAGEYYTCATRTGGTLWCWGDNTYGQLGLGNLTSQDLPQQVTTPAAGGWVSDGAGGFHNCAIRAGGTLWCWGSNGNGQLGLGSLTQQDLPQQVTSPAAAGWASVAGGFRHTCATRTGGSVWCWGYNGFGQLGIGNVTDQDLPSQVTTPALAGWLSVQAKGQNSCAIRTGGTLWCWGDDVDGQLGNGGGPNRDRPVQVTLPPAPGPSRQAAA